MRHISIATMCTSCERFWRRGVGQPRHDAWDAEAALCEETFARNTPNVPVKRKLDAIRRPPEALQCI
jgi:hypothetical protein